MAMLKMFGLIKDPNDEVPQWAREIKMFDDVRQFKIIEESENVIVNENQKIKAANDKLGDNAKLKSILYSNGDFLVEVVGDILHELMDYNPSEFIDRKREDFLVQLDGKKIIGEIKGISENVKGANISQLDTHLQGYIDNNPNESDELKSVLIINYQRKKPLSERDPISESQIRIAERNGSLIIPTITLLEILELYRDGTLSRQKIIDKIIEKTGLLTIEDFK